MRRMLEAQEDVFYYVTVMNENYAHPAMPQGARRKAFCKGMYRFAKARARKAKRAAARLAARSCAKCIAAAEMLEKDWKIAADVWSVTSFTELRRDGMRRRALRTAASGGSREQAGSSNAWQRPRARSSRRATTCARSPT